MHVASYFAFHYQLLLLSMRDMNMAKLTSVDLPLFNGIMSDLFPGIETPLMDYGKVFDLCIFILAAPAVLHVLSSDCYNYFFVHRHTMQFDL